MCCIAEHGSLLRHCRARCSNAPLGILDGGNLNHTPHRRVHVQGLPEIRRAHAQTAQGAKLARPAM